MAVNRGHYRVKVQDFALSEGFDKGGDAAKFADSLVRQVIVVATIGAPKRSGNLSTHHRVNGWLKAGPYNGRASAQNTADYAAAVHEGVKGRIRPTTSRYLVIKFARDGSGFGPRGRTRGKTETAGKVFKKSVRGQKANPWLQRAADAVIARNR